MSTFLEPRGFDAPYSDRPEIGELFSNRIRLTYWDGFCLHIEFAVDRPALVQADRAELTTVPVARVVLPLTALVHLHDQLAEWVRKLEEAGALKRLVPIAAQIQ